MDEQKILDALAEIKSNMVTKDDFNNLVEMTNKAFTTQNRKADETIDRVRSSERIGNDNYLAITRVDRKVDTLHDAVIERIGQKETRIDALETEFEEMRLQRSKATA